jgi:NAD(P)-dependent dehydrogenase (short-subunit alcohol dehydrogenase family)
MTVTSKIWFITGVSRGFGKALAKAVLAEGDIVVGTTRDGKAAIRGLPGKLHLLPLEITDPKAVVAIVAQAQALHGRLDIIVNNAGYGLLGSVEEATEEEITHLFDVNFHGPRRIIQAVLPQLRRQKSGHIVNITSIAGLAPNPGSGYYSATKFAVEGMSQSLAQELSPLGIKVTLVEPGAFRTDFLSDHSIRASQAIIDDYAPTVGTLVTRLTNVAGKQIGDPVRGAAAIIQAVSSQDPPLHLVLGSDALERSRAQQARFSANLERWAPVSLSTDFDESAGMTKVHAAR